MELTLIIIAAMLAVAGAFLVFAWLSERRRARRIGSELTAARLAHEAESEALRERLSAAERDAAVSARDHANAVDQTARADDAARLLREELRATERAREDAELRIATMAADARAFERQIEDLKAAREIMRQEFKATAGEVLKAQGETFKAQNTEQLGHLLTPLKIELDTFRKSLGEAQLKNVEQHGSLKEQIERLSQQSNLIATDAQNLTRALKGDVRMQGAWGEMVVDTILQRLGFQEGVEYSTQESFVDGEGRRRTDYIINLPQGERLIIDSKVSLVDFEAYANADDEIARDAALKRHAASLRAHVKTLASKDYQARVGTRLDFVIMFVPIEAALGAALKRHETLCLEALDSKVAIATPTTLTTQLKTVAAMWRRERINAGAEKIAKRAGALYDKFAGFVEDLEEIGKRLDQTQSAYDKAFSKMKTGNGNLLAQVEKLRALGATASKALPQALLEEAGVDEDELLQIEADHDVGAAPPTVQ
jgi:DNA recombination protein RmuC